MSIFYPIEKRPMQYIFLSVSLVSTVFVNNNIYKQASERSFDHLKYETCIQQNSKMSNSVNDFNLKLACVGTGTSACIVAVLG